MEINKIHLGDARELIHQLEDKSIHCIVTSPPYFGLRDYGMESQMGLEQTPEEFIDGMVKLFHVAKEKLRDDGTLWLNIGDSYARAGGEKSGGNRENMHLEGKQKRMQKLVGGLKEKDLIGIPWMLAFALRADGWYLRQDIIWHKPNPMPESVTDRCTKSHEYIFLLTKSQQYYYNHKAIKKPVQQGTILRMNQPNLDNQIGSDRVPGKTNGNMKPRISGNLERKPASARGLPSNGVGSDLVSGNVAGSVPWEGVTANKRSVWTVTTKPFKEAHFATFPEELIVDCIKAGCPEGGIVLDPFAGAGTTRVVAKKLYRNSIGFELNPEYIKIADKRYSDELGLFT